MLKSPQSAPIPIAGELYNEIQQFYAQQMQLHDDGGAEEWAQTFTEDGTFTVDVYPEPVRGRANLAALARRSLDELAKDGVVKRHWLGMLAVEPHDDETVHARCYALVIATPRGGQAAIHLSTVCEDVLVRGNGTWLVRERRVKRDDLL